MFNDARAYRGSGGAVAWRGRGVRVAKKIQLFFFLNFLILHCLRRFDGGAAAASVAALRRQQIFFFSNFFSIFFFFLM